MKTTFKKKLFLSWVAFIWLFSLTVPVTGVFANGNGGAAPEKEGYTMFKIEGSNLKDGTYTHGPLTVNVTFTVEENEPKSISWSSNIPVFSVYVKGGPGGLTNSYEKGATEGSGLIAPDNKGISHVAFYYKQEEANPADEEKTEEGTDNGGGESEEPAEDNEPAEEQQNDESNQEENNDSSQEENDEANQNENDDSSQEENDEANQNENDDSSQEENDEANQNENDESNQEENDESNQEDKESEEGTKENGNKSTEIHLHLKNCTAPVEKVEVQLNGKWSEMSNPGNSPLYKLKDGGEFVKDDITAFKLSFESGEEQVYGMEEVKIGVEAEGSINYWLEGCHIAEDEQEENPGEGTEEPGEGTEEPGDGQGDNKGNKSTEIHLHLKNCVAPVAKVFVELNGEWIEMTNPGNSPLYKLKDGGEFVKDDITAFKLQFESGAEITYSVEEVKTGIEAEGSINYWLQDCAIPEDENPEEPGDGTEEPGDDIEEPGEDEESDVEIEIVKELYITINKNIESVVKVTLLIKDGENLEFNKLNYLWKLFITSGLNVSDITGIEFEFEDGTTKVVALNMLSFELENEIIQVDINEAVLGIDSDDDNDEDTGAVQPDNNDNDSSGHGDEKQGWYGDMLPKTGENSKMMFYIYGFLLMTAGLVLRMKKPINQL
ncbi:LPXTG cell wall anchor domain-containing protein [Mesobacillus subterraneus]|uniref:LPXTG cell wall anchor domain-containing protein n=1 Tax=Mesobacillus subterraneus TaxID=285983 RepID=UPI001CFE922D|nr:LPXTG cell wall anchor domain-containing protein [Mesobacillus subterraneus]WLR55787.1 LPXTG cell wall anchor domain-containing protein [Mesobacillus subterraneus]